MNDVNVESIRGVAETPYIKRGDSAYVIVEGPTWEEAEANANKLGGHLVTINDAEEDSFLIKQFGLGYFFGLNDLSNDAHNCKVGLKSLQDKSCN